MDDNLHNNFYRRYVGRFAKRFYTPFDEQYIFKIKSFKETGPFGPYFVMTDGVKDWDWDVEDCVVITNERLDIDDPRVVNVSDSRYDGYNPYH